VLKDSLASWAWRFERGVAYTGEPPFWKALINQSLLTTPEFSIVLTCFVNNPSAETEEPGGTLTLGGTDATLF
jgi:cathepsin D